MKRNQIRIIAGSLKGRKIHFPESLGLRPTPDRVRETLFNWLSPVIRGARCLDLFGGSGALSFEAISRGAEKVVLLEKANNVAQSIQAQALEYQIGERLEIKNVDSQSFLKNNQMHEEPFDIVFVDPPYGSHLLLPSFQLLSSTINIELNDRVIEKAWVKENTVIYAGTDAPIQDTDLPMNWEIIRHQKAGVVYFYLIKIGV